MTPLPGRALEEFKRLIYAESSLCFSRARLHNLEAGICLRMEAVDCRSHQGYLEMLKTDSREIQLLLEHLTTRKTGFFRSPEHFLALGEKVLPEIEKRLQEELDISLWTSGRPSPKPRLSIWSAGCASGEEPYSAAMTVFENLKYPRAWEIEILATDVSRDALKKARLGRYPASEASDLPAWALEKRVKELGGEIIVSDEIASAVRFGLFNLSRLWGDAGPSSRVEFMDDRVEEISLMERFDVIFCRNVMIYFDFAAQERLVNELYKRLKPGGYLFTGDAELLHVYKHSFETADYKDAYFYRKPGSGPWGRES